MNRPLFISFFLVAAMAVCGQPDTADGQQSPVSIPGSDHPARIPRLYIGLHTQGGYSTFVESGAGPVQFHGLEAAPRLSFLVECPRWSHEVGISLPVGAYARQLRITTPQAYSLAPHFHYRSMRLMADTHHWRCHLGIGLDESFDLRYTTPLGNSGVGSSNLLGLTLWIHADYTLKQWRFHLLTGFTPLSLAMRPGYSYMANYDRSISEYVAAHFSQHQWYVTYANALQTELGATLLLRNGNRLGLTYCWHHLTSRTSNSAPHRFDRAAHLLQLSFLFLL